MASVPHLSAPPVLSTPESHVFEDPTPVIDPSSIPQLSDEEVIVRYEIQRTIREIREGRWRRIALQFPDEMVGDGVRVYRFLKRGLQKAQIEEVKVDVDVDVVDGRESGQESELDISRLKINNTNGKEGTKEQHVQLSILADTSYGSCCVDEIAAEHVDAEVVVHYGRSCLSPTARLPVIYVFTTQPLDLDLAIKALKETYADTGQCIILMGDLPYHRHLPALAQCLRDLGYTNILLPDVIHDPSSLIPNRGLPPNIRENADLLKEYALFHIGDPPPALLLTLTSRLSSIHIYTPSNSIVQPALTTRTLRRRYALLTSVSSASIFGILINTLSVKNYMHVVSHVQKLIASAGKKSYTFVVGKVNPAKVANFAEIGGWVVIGCWESSLVESRDFYRPLITPFELELALTDDKDRLWSGEWRSDFEALLSKPIIAAPRSFEQEDDVVEGAEENASDDEDESAPPEYDLRTGRYVSHSRPMRAPNSQAKPAIKDAANGSQSLIKRADGELAQVGGVASPGAEFLKSMKTWKGLGSDYEIAYDEPAGTLIEEGRSGVARGYVVGDEGRKH